MPHRSDAELEAMYRSEQNAGRRAYRRRRKAILQFRKSVEKALTFLPGMPITAEILLSEAVVIFDKEMNDDHPI